jgi:hypothetical protein
MEVPYWGCVTTSDAWGVVIGRSCTYTSATVWVDEPSSERRETGEPGGRGSGKEGPKGTSGKKGPKGIDDLLRELREWLGCPDPDVFLWASAEANLLPLGPMHVSLELIGIIGASLTEGPYTAKIAAVGGGVEHGLSVGGYYGEESIDPFGSTGERHESIILGELGYKLGVVGVYTNPMHPSPADTGMFFGVSVGSFAAGIGGNFDTTLPVLVSRALMAASVRASTGVNIPCE